MPAITVINPASVYVPPTFSYSHAVRMGDLVFVAGQVAQNAKGELVGKGDIRKQTEQVFENLRHVLEAAGSGLDLVGKLTVLALSLDYRPVIHEVRSRVFAPIGHYPASTLAVVTNLAHPDFLVEIDAVARVRSASDRARAQRPGRTSTRGSRSRRSASRAKR
jgi:2-iminobutanoate/2-iminopropanoate deaminase